MPRILLDDPRYYLNRHVQWLDFNRRVLEEARDPGNPLLERVKFLAITANNLDEFVEVRVSSFLQRIERTQPGWSFDGRRIGVGHAGNAHPGPRPVQMFEQRVVAAAGKRVDTRAAIF
jgi:Polyphosphate kinase N-terminal domain